MTAPWQPQSPALHSRPVAQDTPPSSGRGRRDPPGWAANSSDPVQDHRVTEPPLLTSTRAQPHVCTALHACIAPTRAPPSTHAQPPRVHNLHVCTTSTHAQPHACTTSTGVRAAAGAGIESRVRRRLGRSRVTAVASPALDEQAEAQATRSVHTHRSRGAARAPEGPLGQCGLLSFLPDPGCLALHPQTDSTQPPGLPKEP